MTLCTWCGQPIRTTIAEHERDSKHGCAVARLAGQHGDRPRFAPRGTETRQRDLTARRPRRRVR